MPAERRLPFVFGFKMSYFRKSLVRINCAEEGFSGDFVKSIWEIQNDIRNRKYDKVSITF